MRLLVSRDGATRQLALITALITAACLVFYLGMRPQGTANYGGATSGFRWLFWLAPMWLAMLPAAVDRLKRSQAGFALAAGVARVVGDVGQLPDVEPVEPPVGLPLDGVAGVHRCCSEANGLGEASPRTVPKRSSGRVL